MEWEKKGECNLKGGEGEMQLERERGEEEEEGEINLKKNGQN